jgi:excisionase family DNA binding protein
MNELINKDNEWIIHFMGSLDRLLDNYERLTANYRPTLGGERFFTDKEVSARLKVSRRTLQDYRNEGRIAYIQLGGKILYRESDIEKMLNDGYRSAYRQRNLIFLKERSLPYALYCGSNRLPTKRKKEWLTDEAQY